MENHNDHDIDKKLMGKNVDVKMRDKEEFWSEFRTLANSIEQDKPINPFLIPFTSPKFFKVAACFLVLVVALSSITLYNYKNAPDERFSASTIEEYEIFAPNQGVCILTDDQNAGTILWVIDDDENQENSG